MGDDDQAALFRLWREKRGEVEPEDLSGNLIVQLGPYKCLFAAFDWKGFPEAHSRPSPVLVDELDAAMSKLAKQRPFFQRLW